MGIRMASIRETLTNLPKTVLSAVRVRRRADETPIVTQGPAEAQEQASEENAETMNGSKNPAGAASKDGPNLSATELSLAAQEKIRRVLAAPDRARLQAQVGFSTAAALLGGLAATGGATGFVHEAGWVVALGALALFFWGVAAAFFVSGEIASETEPTSQTPSGFPEEAYTKALADASRIHFRTRIAAVLTAPAVGFTGAATVAAETTTPSTPAPEKVFLDVNRPAAIAIERTCTAENRPAPTGFRIAVFARRSDLRNPDLSAVDVRYDSCGTLALRREDIVSYQFAQEP
jgi:hypothetical protein